MVEAYARRFQIQEDLVRDIAREMMESGHAKGVLVQSEARHLCMLSRGPQSAASVTRTEVALGCLSDQSE
jgi:GTP cyclohydrolase I